MDILINAKTVSRNVFVNIELITTTSTAQQTQLNITADVQQAKYGREFEIRYNNRRTLPLEIAPAF